MSETRYTDRPGQPFGAEPSPDHPFVVMIYERPCIRGGFGPHAHVREGVRNGLSFATAEDARANAFDLSCRWFGFDHWAVVNFLTGEEVSS
jgi:hypothetical protein